MYPISHPSLVHDDLQVFVNSSPIGGFRGKAGTIEIRHREGGKKFQKWSSENLESLARLYHQILTIHERQRIINTLVFGKEENGQFSMSFVPYPRCDFIEKYQGTFHTLFGPPSLTNQQMEEIKIFYEECFSDSSFSDPHPSPTKKKREEPKKEKRIDPFCKEEVIKKQEILTYPAWNEEYRYTVLFDHIPKGATRNDPHFLVVPQGNRGHVDGSLVPLNQRKDMLEIAQKVMRSLPPLFETLLYLERNGAQLRGVQHRHIHVIGIQSFPKTLLQKIVALVRQLFLLWFPFLMTLSSRELQERIDCYRTTLQKLQ